MLQTCCFPLSNTRLNPSPITHTRFVQQPHKHAGEEELILQHREALLEGTNATSPLIA